MDKDQKLEALLLEASSLVQEVQGDITKGKRELALINTKIDEAMLWQIAFRTAQEK